LKEVPIHPRNKGERIAKQLMWSDPANDPKDPNATRLANGFKANPRGAGVLWDSTITASFCEKNNVELVVRSHQMMHTGYKFHHQQKLLTVFSASSYCGKNDNQGAVAIFDKASLPKPQCASFHADVIEALEKASSKRPLEKIVSDVLRKIAEAVYDHRCDLLIDMSSHDTSLTGEIPLTVWAASMKQHTSLSLKWKELWPHVRYKDGRTSLKIEYVPAMSC
jgi:protein phosphatase